MTGEQVKGEGAQERRPRVLIIDDEVMLGRTFQLGLEGAFEVVLETSGQGALGRVLSGEAFDAIFCDLRLPEVSGIDIQAAIAKNRPALLPRFVLMTGGAVTDEAREFLESYEGPVLNKPFRLGEVETLTRRLVEREGRSGGGSLPRQ